MKEIRDNGNKTICITTPVGSGKSTMIEAITCNIMDGDPGPMLITGQTNEDVRDWAETGLWPTLAACEPLKSRLPTARGKWRKMELVIPRSPIHLTGANLSGLQSKSERWVIADECWMFRKGMCGEMLNRLHRRWNGRAVLLGQAGFVEFAENEEVIGDDFTLLHYQGEQREWHFECPACKTRQAYSMDQVRVPEDGTHAERALVMTYECCNEECSEQFKDDDQEVIL
jgi:phage terminase large subunit GpA-like protein